MIAAILAVAENNSIGLNNKLPWPNIKEDMSWFRYLTENNIVVMGRNTWESIGKPLKNRKNIVVSSRGYVEGSDKTLENVADIVSLESEYPGKKIFIIGGAKLYTDTISMVDTIFMTRILKEFPGDTFIDKKDFVRGFKCVDAGYVAPKDVNFEIIFDQYVRMQPTQASIGQTAIGADIASWLE